MFRQVGIGATAVLTIGLLAAGCGDDGDTIIVGGSGNELNNTDTISFTSVADNNLAPDGGGLSPNDGDVLEYGVTFNCECCTSDGEFDSNGGTIDSPDNSALILFEVQDGTAFRVYASHFDGSTLTPPVELIGGDIDQDFEVQLNAWVCVPLNTSAYQNAATTVTTEITNTRNNDGNWVIIGARKTSFNNPSLDDNQTTTNAQGERMAPYSWVFDSTHRGTSLTTEDFGGTTRSVRYGFTEEGELIASAIVGGGAKVTANGGNANATMDAPPCHVVSFGVITDGACNTARFGGDALPFSADENPATEGVFNAFDSTVDAQRTAFAFAIPWLTENVDDNGQAIDSDTYERADGFVYRTPTVTFGEPVNYLAAVFCQVVNSFSGGGTYTRRNNGQVDGGGQELQLRQRSFNLSTMTWDANESQIAEPAARNTGNLTSGTAPFPTFYTNGSHVYFKYADASLSTATTAEPNAHLLSLTEDDTNNSEDWVQDNTGGHEGGNIIRAGATNKPGFWEEIIAAVVFSDDGDGTCTPGSARDISYPGGGNHGVAAADNVVINDLEDVYPERHMANFNGLTSSIVGPDSGHGDHTVFFVAADNTNTTGSTNIDREGWVVVLNTDGTNVGGTNPAQWSGTHAEDFHGQNKGAGAKGTDPTVEATNRTSLQDPLVVRGFDNGTGGVQADNAVNSDNDRFTQSSYGPVWFDACQNRTGEWIAIAFLRDTGLSAPTTNIGSFRQALHVNVYQTFRANSGATGGTGTQANADARFSGVTTISGQLAITVPGSRDTRNELLNDAESHENWDSLPVNDFRWQGKLGYRCGMQSNSDILSLLYEQSDGTGDRVFIARITVTTNTNGTPSFTAGTPQELDAADSIQTHRNFNVPDNVAGVTAVPFIDSTVSLGNFNTCDAGLDSTSNGGDVIIVYNKIVDNTDTDGDLGDVETRAVLFTGGTSFTGPFVIGTNSNENVALDGVGPNNAQAEPTQSSDGNNNVLATAGNGDGQIALVCVPNNNDITNNPSYPTSTSTVDIYIYLGDREVTVSTTGGTSTATTNSSARRALYTRKYDGSDNANNTFDARFTPSAATASFAQPTQIDHEQGVSDDTTRIEDAQNGRGVTIIFEANDQLWLQTTADGESYLRDGTTGLSNPALITNNSSSDLIDQEIGICQNNTGDANGAVILFEKEDNDTNDDRLHARTSSGGLPQ